MLFKLASRRGLGQSSGAQGTGRLLSLRGSQVCPGVTLGVLGKGSLDGCLGVPQGFRRVSCPTAAGRGRSSGQSPLAGRESWGEALAGVEGWAAAAAAATAEASRVCGACSAAGVLLSVCRLAHEQKREAGPHPTWPWLGVPGLPRGVAPAPPCPSWAPFVLGVAGTWAPGPAALPFCLGTSGRQSSRPLVWNKR